ncbi:hypothetical protein [Thiocapsa marina]|uniref:Uncharacterized protein n=1 Tax=Thiocapsa marina 5811 TaxID=768671 RepID=F9UGP8_9GAMM|nr:hypothetical protein [Thiocapsa marina]EGV16731.1 hypothetical protein ThimaDRAFT_4101 [Thiocapsa marina 5811]
MNTLSDLFVILLFLSGIFVILSLVCMIFEHVPDEADARPRRTRVQPQRPRRRSRVARPRRKPKQPVTDAPSPSVCPAVGRPGQGARGVLS